MSSIETSPRDVQAIIARYKAIGLFGGLFLGAIVGVMVAGPNFREWWWLRSLMTIAGATALGGFAGYVAGEIAVAGLGAGPGDAILSEAGDHSHVGGLDASGIGSSDGHGGGDS